MLSNIKEQLKDAMFKKDKERINALRNIIAKVKMKEIQKNKELTNEEIQKVLQSMAKQLKDSINQYSDGGRLDLADNESKELDILSEFLPEAMSQEEINSIINDVISELAKTDDNIIDKDSYEKDANKVDITTMNEIKSLINDKKIEAKKFLLNAERAKRASDSLTKKAEDVSLELSNYEEKLRVMSQNLSL